jgi:hypothetical protein
MLSKMTGLPETPYNIIKWYFDSGPYYELRRPVRKANKHAYRCLLADCLDNVRSSTSHNPIGLHGPLRR